MGYRAGIVALCAATMAASATAADSTSSRLRERLPAPPAERQMPAVETKAGDPDGRDATEVRPIASPSEIRLDGAIALSPEYFEAIFARYVNRDLARQDLVALTREVTDAYRAQGYFLSRAVIPPQTLSNGVLTIRVEEGRFVAVEFESGGGDDDLKDYFDVVLAEIPARRSTLERAILTLGDLSGVTIVSSKNVPVQNSRGEFKLVLKVDKDVADGFVHVDNRGEGGGDAVQLSAQAGFNGVGVRGGRLEVNVFTDPGNPSRSQFAEVSASAPLGLRGTIVSISASASNAVDGQFGAGRFRSRGTEVSLSVRHPVVRSRAHSMWVNLELAQSNSDADIETLGLRRDELTMARAGATWDVRDEWGGRNRLNVSATFGRDGFRAPSAVHPMARDDDGTSFTKFTLSASRTQQLTGAWSLFASLRGQYSSDALPEDEEIAFGGARWGRAYDYGEIEGDTGAAGQLELRYTRDKLDFFDSLQAYAFADVAALWIRDGIGEPDAMSSAGLGLRAAFGGGYRAGVEAAVPLDRVPSSQTDRNPRVFATVSREF